MTRPFGPGGDRRGQLAQEVVGVPALRARPAASSGSQNVSRYQRRTIPPLVNVCSM